MGISSIASKGWQYFKRAGKLYPDFALGTCHQIFTQAMRSTIRNRNANGQSYMESVWSGIKKGTQEAEKHNKQMAQKHGGFWKGTWASLKSFPAKVAQGWRVGGQLADKAGKKGFSKFWSQFKGSMSGMGKRMPLIGTLMIAVTELPNIFSAFNDKGIVGGIAETGKSGLRLGAGMAGAAIGQAIIPIPIVGGIIGYMAGDWLMSKFTGKSHSEKKAEMEEALKQQQTMLQQQYAMNPFGTGIPHTQGIQPQINTPQPTMTPQQLMALQQMLYSGATANPMEQDFMAMTSGMNRLNFQC